MHLTSTPQALAAAFLGLAVLPAHAASYYMIVPKGGLQILADGAPGSGSGNGPGIDDPGYHPNSDELPPDGFGLAANKMTVTCSGAAVGTEAEYLGKTWLVVDNDMWQDEVSKPSGFKHLCTSHVTAMTGDAVNWTPVMTDYLAAINSVPTWDTSNVTTMQGLFMMESDFNQPIGYWDTSRVTSMYSTLAGASSFNQPLDSWDVSQVTDMANMFYGSNFNKPLARWNVGNVVWMGNMFESSSMAQDLSCWDVSNVSDYAYFAEASPLGEHPEHMPRFIGSDWEDLESTPGCQGGGTADASDYPEVPPVGFARHPNGVTITCVGATPGTKAEFEGILWVVVNNEQWRKEVKKQKAFNHLCTSHVTAMTFDDDADEEISDSYLAAIDTVPTWDTSKVTTMASLFAGADEFNQDISSWDVSNVTNMHRMFYLAWDFNQPIGAWNVSKVTDMSRMFEATYFNQPIGSWNVSNVTDMSGMFDSARKFNQPLNAWNVSNVTDMAVMFNQAYVFNQPLDQWNTSKVTDMQGMFGLAKAFNQPIGSWDVSKVTTMEGMFSESVFNQPIGGWNVSNVTDLGSMFNNNYVFNQPLDSWDVSGATSLSGMFWRAYAFNQPLPSWDVSNAEYLDVMFGHTYAFQQNLSCWNVQNTLNYNRFDEASGMAWYQVPRFGQTPNAECVDPPPEPPAEPCEGLECAGTENPIGGGSGESGGTATWGSWMPVTAGTLLPCSGEMGYCEHDSAGANCPAWTYSASSGSYDGCLRRRCDHPTIAPSFIPGCT